MTPPCRPGSLSQHRWQDGRQAGPCGTNDASEHFTSKRVDELWVWMLAMMRIMRAPSCGGRRRRKRHGTIIISSSRTTMGNLYTENSLAVPTCRHCGYRILPHWATRGQQDDRYVESLHGGAEVFHNIGNYHIVFEFFHFYCHFYDASYVSFSLPKRTWWLSVVTLERN